MAARNYATEIAPKPSAAIREQTPPEYWFEHTSPAAPVGAPVYPGQLNSTERAEVDRWLSAIPGQRAEILASMATRTAILKVAEFETYYDSAPYQAWVVEDKLERIQQWRNKVAEVVTDSTEAVPDACAEPVQTVDSGTIGTDPIVVSLTCATGGATIYYRIDGGSWVIYSAPVTVPVDSTLHCYASAHGLADSTTEFIQNFIS